MESNRKKLARIIVLDDLLDKREALEFYKNVLNQPLWHYGRSSEGKKVEYPFWGAEFHTGLIEPKIKLIMDRVNKRLVNTSIKSLKTYRLMRIDGNGATVGSSGYPHNDTKSPQAISLLIYGNPEWNSSWGGETKFFDDSRREVIHAVMPKLGRAVVFPSNFQHAAAPTTPIFKGVRMTLSLVFTPEKEKSRRTSSEWKPTTRIRPAKKIVIAKMLAHGSQSVFYIMKDKRYMAKIQLQAQIAATIERIWKDIYSLKSVTVANLSKRTGMPHNDLVEYLSLLTRYKLLIGVR